MGTYTGTSRSDTIIGRDRVADDLYGFAGDDFLLGDGGDDWFYGGQGADVLFGGTGIDTASYADSDRGVTVNLATRRGFGGTAEGDTLFDIENLYGSNHYDILTGNDQANWIHAGDGGGWIKGGGGADTLWGSHGVFDDYLDGGTGVDDLHGGRGNDTYYVDHRDDEVFERWGEGTTDRVLTSVTYYLGDADVEILATNNPDGTAPIQLYANGLNNRLIGNDGMNVLDGWYGVDTMIGNGGNDRYMVMDAGDTIVEAAGEGYDIVMAAVDYTLTPGADVEELVPYYRDGTEAINLTGNASGNIVKGNDGNNRINGGDGNDELWGDSPWRMGAGEDTFRFDTPLNAMLNVDWMPDFDVEDDTIQLENTVFGAFAAGDLAEERFVTGAALQTNDNIIYDNETGALFYDSDGSGTAADPIQFATVSPGTALTHLDFVVV
jgi:Ca2+-binding RTX toxin-like protein